MTKIIEVTEDDIEFGIPQDSYACPIAHALRRAFPDAKHVRAGWYFIKIDEKEYASNEVIRRFIDNYDDGHSVEPFSFDLDSLEPYKRE